MKFTTLFAVLATLAAAVSPSFSSTSHFTNAELLARGLPPSPPIRRSVGTPTYAAKRSKPSKHHDHDHDNSCNGGEVKCCNSLSSTSDPKVKKMVEGLLGLVVAPSVGVGLACSSITAVGLKKKECTSQTVCCEGNHYKGLVVVGCSPINI